MGRRSAGLLRIGELSRRTGVSVELLRAWETRYGLVRPRRTPGGFRLYNELDESRVRRMRGLVGSGLSASEAAHAVLRGQDATGAARDVPPGIAAELDLALLALDGPVAHATLDRLFAAVPLELSISRVILPELRSIGDRWAAGRLTVAQEHFASALLRSRLLGLARGWDQGRGRRAVLACAPGELHDIGLICFGLLLHREGWRVLYLGQDTPVDAAATAVARSRADALVMSSVEQDRFTRAAPALAEIGRSGALHLGGAGATVAGARRLRGVLLPPDLAEAAAQLGTGPVGRTRERR